MKILIIIAAAISLLFAISFLLDMPFFTTNWLRYTLVVLLALLVLVISAKMVWNELKELKNKINQ